MMTKTTAAMSEAACRAPKPPVSQRRLTGVELKTLYFRNGVDTRPSLGPTPLALSDTADVRSNASRQTGQPRCPVCQK
jgi:hypothetical protein